MTTIELEAYKAEVARDVLSIDSRKLLDKIKKLITKEEKKTEDECVDDYKPRTHDELVADFKEALNEVKLSKEGKIKLRPAEELLNEI